MVRTRWNVCGLKRDRKFWGLRFRKKNTRRGVRSERVRPLWIMPRHRYREKKDRCLEPREEETSAREIPLPKTIVILGKIENGEVGDQVRPPSEIKDIPQSSEGERSEVLTKAR